MQRVTSIQYVDIFQQILVETDDLIESTCIYSSSLFSRLKDEKLGTGIIEFMVDKIDSYIDDPEFRKVLNEGPEKRQLFQLKSDIKKREEIIRIIVQYLKYVIVSNLNILSNQQNILLPDLESEVITRLLTKPIQLKHMMCYVNDCIKSIDINTIQTFRLSILKFKAIITYIDKKIFDFESTLDTKVLTLHENANKRQIISMISSLELKKLNIETSLLFMNNCQEQINHFRNLSKEVEDNANTTDDDHIFTFHSASASH